MTFARRRSRGFSLLELLVVIGIVALLLSLLLPVLSRVREAARTTTCLARLRSIGQAMLTYVGENDGYIPGSGNTSGRHLWKVSGTGSNIQCVRADPNTSIDHLNGPIECNDYVYPLARIMNLRTD